MGFVLRNFHIIVVAFISLVSAAWVGVEPDRAVHLVKPVVEDAAELGEMAAVVYKSAENIDWRAASEEAMTMYVAALRMPSMLFERLETRMADVNEHLEKLGHSGGSSPTKKLTGDQKLSILRDLQSGRHLRLN